MQILKQVLRTGWRSTASELDRPSAPWDESIGGVSTRETGLGVLRTYLLRWYEGNSCRSNWALPSSLSPRVPLIQGDGKRGYGLWKDRRRFIPLVVGICSLWVTLITAPLRVAEYDDIPVHRIRPSAPTFSRFSCVRNTTQALLLPLVFRLSCTTFKQSPTHLPPLPRTSARGVAA